MHTNWGSLTSRVLPWLVVTSIAASSSSCEPHKYPGADIAALTEAADAGSADAPSAEPPVTGATPVNQAEGPPSVGSVEPISMGAQGGPFCEPGNSACETTDAGSRSVVCMPTGPRDCASELDNDCDGQPDNTPDAVCICIPGAVESCDEHLGFDGLGQCKSGTRTCLFVGDGGIATDWSACDGAVGPGAADSCTVAGDDTDCDGLPNEGCSCVDGATQQCGSTTDVGVCAFGVSNCINGAFGECLGAVPPAARDSCTPGDDSSCNGVANEGCSCVDGETRDCGTTDIGVCAFGVQTCANGVFGPQCVGVVNPAQRNCGSLQDNDCDGRPDNTLDNVCTCVVGQTQVCGEHPGLDGNGQCRAGERTCVPGPNGASTGFGTECVGSVGPLAADSCSVENNDANCNGVPNDGCGCVTARGNEDCSEDPEASRCNAQGQCVPCQTDNDCSLVGDANSCVSGRCTGIVQLAIWPIEGGEGPTIPAAETATGVTGLNLSKSLAFRAAPALEIFGAVDWPGSNTLRDPDRYFEFGVTAAANRTITYDRLEFSISSNNFIGDSALWEIRSSVDAFGSVVADGSVNALGFPGSAVVPSIRSVGTRSGTVSFRLYIFSIDADELPPVGIRSSGNSNGLVIFGGVN